MVIVKSISLAFFNAKTCIASVLRIKFNPFPIPLSIPNIKNSLTIFILKLYEFLFSFSRSTQFRAAVTDCTLPETDDTYLLRWLVGIITKIG